MGSPITLVPHFNGNDAQPRAPGVQGKDPRQRKRFIEKIGVVRIQPKQDLKRRDHQHAFAQGTVHQTARVHHFRAFRHQTTFMGKFSVGVRPQHSLGRRRQGKDQPKATMKTGIVRPTAVLGDVRQQRQGKGQHGGDGLQKLMGVDPPVVRPAVPSNQATQQCRDRPDKGQETPVQFVVRNPGLDHQIARVGQGDVQQDTTTRGGVVLKVGLVGLPVGVQHVDGVQQRVPTQPTGRHKTQRRDGFSPFVLEARQGRVGDSVRRQQGRSGGRGGWHAVQFDVTDRVRARADDGAGGRRSGHVIFPIGSGVVGRDGQGQPALGVDFQQELVAVLCCIAHASDFECSLRDGTA